LKDLTEKEYITRDFTPIYGILTKPAVYCLSSLGRATIKKTYSYHLPIYLKRIARDNKASKGFKIRCQVLADFYLTLFSASMLSLKKESTDKEDVGGKSKKRSRKLVKEGIGVVDILIAVLKVNRVEED